MRRQNSTISSIDKTIGELQNEATKRKRRESQLPSRRSSNASHDMSADLPKSISKQLLDTLTRWEPMNSRWTIGKLFQRVTMSVTEFLKIPMNEMNSEQFYSLYADVDNQQLGFFQPLPQEHEEGQVDPI